MDRSIVALATHTGGGAVRGRHYLAVCPKLRGMMHNAGRRNVSMCPITGGSMHNTERRKAGEEAKTAVGVEKTGDVDMM